MQWIADRIQDFTEADRQNSIGRTDRFLASASSDISEEMMELSFLECFQIFLCFCLLFFFKLQSKKGVRIIHIHALYTGKYSTDFHS